jgi:arylsulfatase A-like enzyme
LPEKPNIFLITIDCLRYDYLGCYGNVENLTPSIDEIAKNGIIFLQAIVNGPSTPFSFPSIFTSTYSLMDPQFPNLSKFRSTLAEVIRNNGYKTAGINSNPYLSKYYNYDNGFSFFDDIFSESQKKIDKGVKGFIKRHKKLKSFIKKVYKTLIMKYKIKPPYQRASIINKKALKWLKENTGKKFIWIHYMDTHHPFFPPGKFRDTSKNKMYRAEKILKRNPSNVSNRKLTNIKNQYKNTIKYVDNELGKFFEELKNLGLFENSLFILTADHGEEFREHGGFSHQCKLYDELIHVPLIMKGPKLPINLKKKNLISLIDLAPTILDYLNMDKCEDFIGKSFLPLLVKSDKTYKRQYVISESLTKDNKVSLSLDDSFRVLAYRTEEWKLILNYEKNSSELYNLKEENLEINNIRTQYLEIAKDFEQKLLDHVKFENEIRNQLQERQKLGNSIKKFTINNKNLGEKK